MSLKIRVITPDRIVWNTSADEIVLPSTSGQFRNSNKPCPINYVSGYWYPTYKIGNKLDTDCYPRRICRSRG